jgi:hypothetical protein
MIAGCPQQFELFMATNNGIPRGDILLAHEFESLPEVTQAVLDDTIDIFISYAAQE